MTYHNLLSPCVQGLVSGYWLTRCKRGNNSSISPDEGVNTQEMKAPAQEELVEGKDTSRTRCLFASYRRPSLRKDLFSFPNAAGGCCATDLMGRSLFCSCQNAESKPPNFSLLQEKMSSHADPGSVLRKSCHRSQGRNRRSNPKHLTLSKKEGLWIGNAIFLSISMGEVNQSPPPAKIIPELKLTWNGKCIQMRFWSDVLFKYKKKQIRSNLALVWIKTITTKSGP